MLKLNKVQIAGNVGQDPKIKWLDGGKCIANFSLAVNDSYIDKSGAKIETTEWINVVFFGKPAEIIEKHVQKGTNIYVEGKFQTRTWDKGGVKQYSTEVKGESFQFIGSQQQPTPY